MKKILTLSMVMLFGCAAQKSISTDSPEEFFDLYVKAHKAKDEYVLDRLFYPVEKLAIHPDQAKYIIESIKRSKKHNEHFEKMECARVKMVKAWPNVKTNVVGELNIQSDIKDEWMYVFDPEYLIYIYQPDGVYSVYAFGRKDGSYYGVPLVPSVETARVLLNKFLSEN